MRYRIYQSCFFAIPLEAANDEVYTLFAINKPRTSTMPARKLKIALISPKGPLYRHRGGIWKKSLRYQPLTLTTLAALIPPEIPVDLQLFDEGIADVPLDLAVDLVGLTVLTGTAMRAYELADHFRRRGIKVVLGGPHVTLIPEDAQPHADAVVTGYGEDSWPRLLRDFAAGQLQARYEQSPGLDLAGRPFARRDLLPGKRYLTNNVFEATRGCVHNCDFCVVPAAWGRKPLQKPVADVVADIRQHGARKLIFVDLNLIADRGYALRLFTALMPLKLQWYGLATVLLAEDPVLLELAARSGCKGLLMGLESISPQNLRENHKGFNSPEKFVRVVERLHEHGIALQGCFVFGLDQDEPEVFLKTAEFAVQAKIDLPRFAIVTPFPNTALYQRLHSENRILTKNWELYDGQHVVFRPAKLSVRELQDGTEIAWKHAYSFRSIARRISHSPAPWPVKLGTNLGYRFYANNLSRFYNCDWIIGRTPSSTQTESPPAEQLAVSLNQ
ncbi:MAG TPA: radical SAM protein [Verrucomicrobiae bacterium]